MVRRWWAVCLLLVVLCAPVLAVSDEDEVDIGRQLSGSLEKQVHILHDDATRSHLQSIIERLAPGTGRALPYHVELIDAPDINAITFPGGFIYVYRGLLALHPNDDEFAGVLGHEMAHAVFSHGYKKLVEMTLMKRFEERVHNSRFSGLTGTAKLTNVLLLDGVGRRAENEADYWGVKFAAKAGYDPRGLLDVLEVFARMERQHPSLMQKMFATHPPPQERILRVRRELREMGVRV